MVAETLQLTRKIGRADAYKAWMYLSDHGQEVGHGSNHAGRSPATASGYRIPTVIWRSSTSKTQPSGIEARPFRADGSAWTIADLMNVEWSGNKQDRNALAHGYRWQAPVLPVEVTSFEK